ncbi:hypothetical protein ACA910_012490 [Epithemia clementina (nom. ined.)]
MSTNLNMKQVSNVERRTWDLEAYEKRAQQRQIELDERERLFVQPGKAKLSEADGAAAMAAAADDDKEEFRPAASGAVGPEGSDRAFLKARRGKVAHIDSQVGKIEMVSAEAAATTKSKSDSDDPSGNKQHGVVKTGVGWHCKVCDCFLKDSHTYLDHINGRKHQRKLGYSMRVERSTKEDLVAKLQLLKQKKKDDEILVDQGEEIDFNDIVRAKDEELQKRREERRKRRKERKAKVSPEEDKAPGHVINIDTKNHDDIEPVNQQAEHENEEEEEEDEQPQIDPNLAAMMGFAGFGSTNQN